MEICIDMDRTGFYPYAAGLNKLRWASAPPKDPKATETATPPLSEPAADAIDFYKRAKQAVEAGEKTLHNPSGKPASRNADEVSPPKNS